MGIGFGFNEGADTVDRLKLNPSTVPNRALVLLALSLLFVVRLVEREVLIEQLASSRRLLPPLMLAIALSALVLRLHVVIHLRLLGSCQRLRAVELRSLGVTFASCENVDETGFTLVGFEVHADCRDRQG